MSFVPVTSILVITLCLLLNCTSFAQPHDNFPENVRQSFAWGITDNKALTRADLETMAQTILVKSYNLNQEEALARTKQLSEASLRRVCTSSFLIDYVEVPLESLEKFGEVSSKTSQFMAEESLASPIKFQKNGQEYIRWFIHPLRTDLKLLELIGNPSVQRGQFLAQLTESRSVLLMDRRDGNYWTIKLSLPVSVGPFKDKAYKAHQAEIQFNTSDYLLARQKNGAYKDTQFLHEQEYVGLKMEGLSEGQLVRSIAVLKDGSYLLPYTAIYSKGLGAYIKPLADLQLLRQEEKRWLSQEPGKAAANIYYADGLVVNSNHSQNSLLLLSAEKVPLKYERRDMDFDWNNEGRENSPLAKIISRSHIVPTSVDFSMTNGFGGRSFYSGPAEEHIVEGFFKAFSNQYQTRRNKPLESGSLSHRITFANHHYLWDTSRLNSSDEVREAERVAFLKSVEDYKVRFPELLELPTHPKEALAKLILRPLQRIGDVGHLAGDLRDGWGPEVEVGWQKLSLDFLNVKTRSQSAIWKAMHENRSEPFWNLCILAGQLYTPDQERFVQTLIQEATKTENGSSLWLIFHKLRGKGIKPSFALQAEDFSADYRRLLQSYVRKAADPQDYENLKGDIKTLGISIPPPPGALLCRGVLL